MTDVPVGNEGPSCPAQGAAGGLWGPGGRVAALPEPSATTPGAGPGPQGKGQVRALRTTPRPPPHCLRPCGEAGTVGDSALDSAAVLEALRTLLSLDGSAPCGSLAPGKCFLHAPPRAQGTVSRRTSPPNRAQTFRPGLPFSRPPEEPRAAAGGSNGPTPDGWPGSFMRLTTFSDSCGRD